VDREGRSAELGYSLSWKDEGRGKRVSMPRMRKAEAVARGEDKGEGGRQEVKQRSKEGEG